MCEAHTKNEGFIVPTLNQRDNALEPLLEHNTNIPSLVCRNNSWIIALPEAIFVQFKGCNACCQKSPMSEQKLVIFSLCSIEEGGHSTKLN